MFGLAIWDTETKRLVLARDPAGIKPLYYSIYNNQLIFSSELMPILEAGVPRILNQKAAAHYFRLLYVPKGMTMIKGVHKLLPGRMLVYENGVTTEKQIVGEWSATAPRTYGDAVAAVRSGVEEAVTRQLVSDRPVGVYLSGGIDSSAILAAAVATHPAINTYSVGFDLEEGEEPGKFNADMELAARTAKHFGATHHEYRLRADEVVALMPKMVRHLHCPVANATALAQLFLADKTKETATVVLSGEGGDELFGGYERYRLAHLASYLGPFAKGGVDRYAQLMFQKDAELVLKNPQMSTTKDLFRSEFGTGNITDELMRADEHNWLVDEALLRADAMGMAASIEVRVPFLDLELAALARALPRQWKVTGRVTKRILRDAFRDVLPPEILSQPKRGWFSPGAKWLRRPEFVQYAEGVFVDGYTPASALLDMPAMRQLWGDHRSKRGYHYSVLWAALVFLSWAKEYRITL
ncbi:MAG: asparagine synthase (glutamine-hydrolyzing), partial [Patescibacteria group bacterium]